MHINTSTYLYPQDGGSWLKPICSTSKGPKVKGKWPLEE